MNDLEEAALARAHEDAGRSRHAATAAMAELMQVREELAETQADLAVAHHAVSLLQRELSDIKRRQTR